MSETLQFRIDLPREALADERAAAAAHGYQLGPEAALPPDPDAVEAHFIEPVTLIASCTLAMMAWRVLNHWLVKDGRGVLIDARSRPPLISRLQDVPAGFIVLIKPDGSTETVAAGKTDDEALTALLAKALPGAA